MNIQNESPAFHVDEVHLPTPDDVADNVVAVLRGRTVFIEITQELADGATSARLLTDVFDRVSSESPEMLVLNLHGVNDINDAGIEKVIRLAAHARSLGARVVASQVNRHVRGLFCTAGITDDSDPSSFESHSVTLLPRGLIGAS